MKAQLIPYKNPEYVESNFIIQSKGRRNLLESKLLAISIYNIDHAQELYSEDQLLELSIPVSEIKELIGRHSGSIYESIREAAKKMIESYIYIEDIEDPKKNFKYVNIVTSAESNNGIFTITFNKQIQKYITQLKGNFTKLSITTMCSFNNTAAFVLYQTLKSRCYRRRGEKNQSEIYEIPFLVSELKLELGVVDANEEGVKKVLQRDEFPSYDEAVEASRYDSYKNYTDFKRFILDKAVNDINDKTEMTVSFVPGSRSGRGGKVKSVIFTVDLEDKQEKDVINEENNDAKEAENLYQDKEKVLEKIEELISEPLKVRDIIAIAQAADYNLEKIKKAYSVAKTQKKIDNIVGFMINAIKENYDMPVKEINKVGFCDIEQHNYDFDELERIIDEKAMGS